MPGTMKRSEKGLASGIDGSFWTFSNRLEKSVNTL
jgi:hypothetical protein